MKAKYNPSTKQVEEQPETMSDTLKIEDYLHLYLRCEVMHDERVCKLIGVHEDYCVIEQEHVMVIKVVAKVKIQEVKPLLRPLSNMTEEEMNKCGNLIYDFSDDKELNRFKWSDFDFGCAEQFHWLLSKHFDLFGLIEAGIAIDKTTLK